MPMQRLTVSLSDEDLKQLREHYDGRQPSPLKLDNPSRVELASWLAVIAMTTIEKENKERRRLAELLKNVPVTVHVMPLLEGGDK